MPGVTNSEGASAGASRSVMTLATSHGFAGGYAQTSHGMLGQRACRRAAAAWERDYAHHSGRRHAALLEAPEAIGRLAGERAVARLNPARIASGDDAGGVRSPGLGGA